MLCGGSWLARNLGVVRSCSEHFWPLSRRSLLAHGGVFGISKASKMKQRACLSIFSQRAFSIQDMDCAVQSVNAAHRDIPNMIGHANHAVVLRNFLEGRVWIEDSYVQCSGISHAGKAASHISELVELDFPVPVLQQACTSNIFETPNQLCPFLDTNRLQFWLRPNRNPNGSSATTLLPAR